MGFNIQIGDVFVDVKDIVIKIEGKSFDNRIIGVIERFIKPRIPGLVKNAIQEQINPLFTKYTCSRIE